MAKPDHAGGGNGGGGGGDDDGGGGITTRGARIYGTEGDDLIIGNSKDNEIYGYGGNDQIYGEGGDDWINGGEGDDLVDGGSGHDTLSGGLGTDHIYGGTGNDTLRGDAFPSEYDDYLTNGSADYLYGGDGDDSMYGMFGGDHMWGGAGADSYWWVTYGESNEANGVDTIYDFNPSEGDALQALYELDGDQDGPDYKLLDGDPLVDGHQPFADIEARDAALSGNGGEATFTFIDADNDGVSDDVRLDLFLDGDTNPEMTINFIDFTPDPDMPLLGLNGIYTEAFYI